MKVSSIFFSFASVALVSQGLAAAEVEIGGEYQVNVTNSNDGLNEPKEVPQTSLNLKGAKIALKGKLSDQITWNVLYKAKESELERYWLTNKVADNLDVSVGKQKIKVYGLHRKLASSTTTPVTGAYLANNPLTDKMALDVTYKLAGTFSLQLVEDYSKCSTSTVTKADTTTGDVTSTSTTACTSWNSGTSTSTTQKQPAAAVEWYGAFGEFSPLVQYSVYDLGKSSSASVGLRYKTDVIDSYFDYTVDTRAAKGNKSGTLEFEEQESKFEGVVVYGEYKLGTFTPYIHYSTLVSALYEADGITEAKKILGESNAAGKLDNNGTIFALGSHFENWGAYYRPFVQVAVSSGKFVDPTDPTKQKDLSKTDLVAGVIGKF